uniref:Uncharacterized protein n=1 Tax=Mesocestoides corti TaxID=53468 RepID=A0A5K3F2B2_MESCO
MQIGFTNCSGPSHLTTAYLVKCSTTTTDAEFNLVLINSNARLLCSTGVKIFAMKVISASTNRNNAKPISSPFLPSCAALRSTSDTCQFSVFRVGKEATNVYND